MCVVTIASLLLPSFVVILVSIRPPTVALHLLLPHIKCLDGGVNRHLLHAPMQTTEEEESCGAGLTIFYKHPRKIKKSVRHL